MTPHEPSLTQTRGDPLTVAHEEPPSPRASSRGRTTWSSVSEVITTFVAPTTLVGALVFYFGWTRTRAWWLYFGVDPSVLGFSNQDYVLRSVNALFPALLVAAIAAAAVAWAVRRTDRLVADIASGRAGPNAPRALSRARPIIGTLGAASFAVGVAALFWGVLQFEVLSALALGLGAMLLALAGRLRTNRKARTARGTWEAAALWVVLILSAFWAISDFALITGRGAARFTGNNLNLRPAVTIFSAERLGLDGPGVTSTPVASGERYRFRYTGLRMLLRTGGRFLFAPERWEQGDAVFLIDDEPSLRFEFSFPRSSSPAARD
jgi:hypothetical protein